MLWLIKFVLSEKISVKTRTYVQGKNYAIVLSPNIFELAPFWQYFAHVGIHCSYSFYLTYIFPNLNSFHQSIFIILYSRDKNIDCKLLITKNKY